MSSHATILTDCDDVLLDWSGGFEKWMARKGYPKMPKHDVTAYGLHIHYGLPRHEIVDLINEFNESAAIGFLEPCEHAVEYVQELHNYGFNFPVITSLGTYEYSHELRHFNLDFAFNYIIDEVEFLEMGAPKNEALKKWVGKADYWVEDKLENAIAGADLGFKTYLIAKDHNQTDDPRITRVKNWKEIYEDMSKGA